jgi:hypothetical protein
MKKLSNKVLLLTLIVLVSIFGISKWLRSPGLESTLPQQLITVDTAKVSRIKISMGGDSVEITLQKEGTTWWVSKNNKKTATDAGVIQSMLSSLIDVRPERLASRKKEKWDTYQVSDRGTRVEVYEDEDKSADVIVGKTSYSQAGAYTYSRLYDEDEVYAISGTMGYQFNKGFDEWRNKSLLRLTKDDITKVIFQYPADSSFVLEKRDSVWYVNDIKAEDSKTNTYLSQLTFKNGTTFADDFGANTPATISIQVEGKNGVLAILKAWMVENSWVVSSSTQENTFFSVGGTPIINDVFVGKKKFVP